MWAFDVVVGGLFFGSVGDASPFTHFHVAVRLLSEDIVLFRERELSFCIDGHSPLRTGEYVSCERSAPNFVIITLKPRSFRFLMKTFPSYTGLW